MDEVKIFAANSASAPHVFVTERDGCPVTAHQNKPGGRLCASKSVAINTMARVRTVVAAPTHQDGGRDIPDDATHTVMFRHPGYRGEHNIIMVLPALDNAQEGIHHETALNACAVVAGNRWNGFLCEQRIGSRVLTPRDEVLKGKEYYFRVSDDAEGQSAQRLCYKLLTETR
jgi:hypothetical protein